MEIKKNIGRLLYTIACILVCSMHSNFCTVKKSTATKIEIKKNTKSHLTKQEKNGVKVFIQQKNGKQDRHKNKKTTNGGYLLNSCIKTLDMKRLVKLLSSGADPNEGNSLLVAIQSYNPKAFLYLLMYGANPNRQTLGNKSIQTILQEYKNATLKQNGDVKRLENLNEIEEILRIDPKDYIILALQNGMTENLPQLLTSTNKDITSLLQLAISKYDPKATSAILSHDVNSYDQTIQRMVEIQISQLSKQQTKLENQKTKYNRKLESLKSEYHQDQTAMKQETNESEKNYLQEGLLLTEHNIKNFKKKLEEANKRLDAVTQNQKSLQEITSLLSAYQGSKDE